MQQKQINSELYRLLLSNENFCNFCFKTIQDNSFFVEDIIYLDNNTSLELSAILTTVLGSQLTDKLFSGLLCQMCTENAIASYKYIEMCKRNALQLQQTVDILECSLSKITSDINNHCSVFITVDLKNFNSQIYFDDEPVRSKSNVLEKVNKISLVPENHFKCDNESSINFDTYDATLNNEEKKKKKRKLKKYYLKTIAKEVVHDADKELLYKCKVCLKTYSNHYRLKQHYLRVHAPKTFKCKECSRCYGSAALLTQHKYDSHSPLMCSDCGKSYTSRSTFKIHTQSHSLNLICQLCGKVFKNSRNFKNHLNLKICDKFSRRVSLMKKFVCDYCNKGYSSKSTLRAHIKFEHGDGNAHVCSWCDKKFNAASRLSAHVVTHTQEKKFSCDICGGRFVTKESLCYHTRIHTGEKPYQCDYCDQRFLSSSRRSEHVRRHHQDPMIECDVCQSKFRFQSCLKRHKKRHFNPNSRLHYTRLVSEDKEV